MNRFPYRKRGSLEQKIIDGGKASNESMILLPKGSTEELAALERNQGSIAYDTTLGQTVIDSGAGFGTVSNPGDITSVTAGTGLDGGGTNGAVTLDLADTAVTPGSYTNADITVDQQGRITAAASGSGGAGIEVLARYKSSQGQSFANAAYTIIDFNTQEFDVGGPNVTTGAGWVFTAPADGYYLVSAAILITGTTTWAENEILQLSLFKNGSEETVLTRRVGLDSSGGATANAANGSTVIQLSAADEINIRVFQDSGAAITDIGNDAYTHVSIVKLA